MKVCCVDGGRREGSFALMKGRSGAAGKGDCGGYSSLLPTTRSVQMNLGGERWWVIRFWGVRNGSSVAHAGLVLDDVLWVNSKSIGTAVDLFEICLRFCSTMNIAKVRDAFVSRVAEHTSLASSTTRRWTWLLQA